jgi:hypothetical protein
MKKPKHPSQRSTSSNTYGKRNNNNELVANPQGGHLIINTPTLDTNLTFTHAPQPLNPLNHPAPTAQTDLHPPTNNNHHYKINNYDINTSLNTHNDYASTTLTNCKSPPTKKTNHPSQHNTSNPYGKERNNTTPVAYPHGGGHFTTNTHKTDTNHNYGKPDTPLLSLLLTAGLIRAVWPSSSQRLITCLCLLLSPQLTAACPSCPGDPLLDTAQLTSLAVPLLTFATLNVRKALFTNNGAL